MSNLKRFDIFGRIQKQKSLGSSYTWLTYILLVISVVGIGFIIYYAWKNRNSSPMPLLEDLEAKQEDIENTETEVANEKDKA
jgi:arginine exporter protein ArgO